MENNIKRYGTGIESKASWESLAQRYTKVLDEDYHQHRLQVINQMIPKSLYSSGIRIFDFGCGDAIHFEQFLASGALISGVDISSTMIDYAQERLESFNRDSSLVDLGDVQSLKEIESDSLDAMLSFNVLAYLSDEEAVEFYTQTSRVLKPGGLLIVTHSNELFDMFSLNNHTVNFHQRHLIQNPEFNDKISQLLLNGHIENPKPSFNIRENPLNYKYKLAQYNLEEIQQEFAHLHEAPPILLPAMKKYPSTLNWPEELKWKLMFICSIYGSVSVLK